MKKTGGKLRRFDRSIRPLRIEAVEDRRLLSVTLPIGKGDWYFYLSDAESNLGKSSAAALFSYEASQGVKWVVVKAQDGSSSGSSWGYSSSVVTAAHNAGLKIYAYAYVYGNDGSHTEASELSTTLSVISSTSPDGFIIDAEVEYQGQPTEAAAYSSGIKAKYPNLFLAYAPFPIITDHESFPYIQFGENCDAVMPQAYFETGSGYSPSGMVTELDSQWSYWDNIWATGGYPGAVKPIIPICQAYNDSYWTDNGSDLSGFVTDLRNDATPAQSGGYQGVSFFDGDYETSTMRSEINASYIGLPAVPTGLGASAAGIQSMSVSWTANGTVMGNAATYILYRATSSSGPWTQQIYSGSNTSYADSGLQFNTKYYYEVMATNAAGSSALSSAVSATTLSGVPTGLTATTTGATSITASWSAVTGATTYTLQRATASTGPWTQVYSGSNTSYSNTGLQASTPYYFEVDSSTSTGNSAYSSAISTTTLSGVPAGLTATAMGPQTISVNWSSVSGATAYTLQRATASTGPWTQAYSGSSTSYSNTGLLAGTTYYYEVNSSTSTFTSAFSSAASATTSPTITVSSPTNGQTFTTFPITFSGTATDTGGTGLKGVMVDNTTNGSSGSESLTGTSASYSIGGIALEPGPNVIDVESFDAGGNHSTVVAITVNYSPPTWNGGGGSNVQWSDAANWGGTAIAAGEDLAFSGSTSLSTTNNLTAGTQFGNLTFGSTAGAFTLGGNSIKLSGAITNYSTNAQTISLAIGGTAGLTKTGTGSVILSGANNYTGGTVVSQGKLIINSAAALPIGTSLIIGTNPSVVFSPSVAGAAPATAVAPVAVAAPVVSFASDNAVTTASHSAKAAQTGPPRAVNLDKAVGTAPPAPTIGKFTLPDTLAGALAANDRRRQLLPQAAWDAALAEYGH